MPAGSPITVWRYLTMWLWRLLLITAAVLVTVLTFAGAVKFLAEGKLSPLDTLRFMFYATPPMLQYALPFAGGFAATLTYHRFTAENEAVACQAGGVSYRSLLLPALLSGVILSGSLIALSGRIIPDFLRAMQDMVTLDASRIMINTIKRGEAVKFGDDKTLLYADAVERLPGRELHGAYQVLWMTGVLIVRLDDQGRAVSHEGSARSAYVWFFRETGADGDDRGLTRITMVPQDFVGRGSGRAVGQAERMTYSRVVPSPVYDNPKFLGWGDLRRLRADPDRTAVVDMRRRALATILAERTVVQSVREQLQAEGAVRLTDSLGETVVLRGGGLEWEESKKWYRILPPTGRRGVPAVERYSADRHVQTVEGETAWFRSMMRQDAPDDPMTFEVALENVTAEGTSRDPAARRVPTGEVNQARERTFRHLQPARNPLRDLLAESSPELLQRADEHLAAHAWDNLVRAPRDELRNRIKRLHRQITSKEHERLAMAAACLVMVLTGGVMAMRLRESLPLVVYLWSFFPALAAVITILGGQQLVVTQGLVGMPLLWGGVGALALFTAAEYWKLRRH